MGTVKLRTLDDYARCDADVQVTCRKCGRIALFNAQTLIHYC
jgi:hypothetical protein